MASAVIIITFVKNQRSIFHPNKHTLLKKLGVLYFFFFFSFFWQLSEASVSEKMLTDDMTRVSTWINFNSQRMLSNILVWPRLPWRSGVFGVKYRDLRVFHYFHKGMGCMWCRVRAYMCVCTCVYVAALELVRVRVVAATAAAAASTTTAAIDIISNFLLFI